MRRNSCQLAAYRQQILHLQNLKTFQMYKKEFLERVQHNILSLVSLRLFESFRETGHLTWSISSSNVLSFFQLHSWTSLQIHLCFRVSTITNLNQPLASLLWNVCQGDKQRLNFPKENLYSIEFPLLKKGNFLYLLHFPLAN